MELEKTYDPKACEGEIYRYWQDGGYFKGVIDKSKKPFSIVIPPPNVTGQLHLGHAFDGTMQDIITRFRRMQGYAAVWIPGTDHAGIATQIKVEEDMRGEGLTRFDLGKEKFIERVWDWKEKYGSRIVEQLKTLGASCDWDRERFTMDEGLSKAVREVFVQLYEKGLIYQGFRIINWCPECTTALSDTEVEYEEKAGHLWHIKYPIKGTNQFVTVATTRPETMLGDSAVAVNPNDPRYTDLIGKTCILPLTGREIPIIADDYVDPEFGTGCVKITPCHDPNDFEVGSRHNLEQYLILDGEAKVINSGKYNGLPRYEARAAVLADLEALSLLEKTADHTHSVGTCYRCSTVVEPIASKQWFVKMGPLAEPALRAVDSGEIKFIPERFIKSFDNWMNSVRDWCISRQLWWGHQIPAWHCADCSGITVSREDPDTCEHCGSANITRDPDVLDTWFSSALWPFSTLGWPERTPELDFWYPTSVLVTGYDIIFFWVARMIFSGLEQMNERPFEAVLFHGLIRDANGKKMSKSAGNGIDPIEIIDKYGADALRFYIVTGNSPGGDMRFSYDRCEAMRNFSNKLWNAARFVLMNLKTDDLTIPLTIPNYLELEDMWILTKLNTLISEMTENMERYELGVAADKLYDFIWDDYCDWYIELTKPRLNSQDEKQSIQAQRILGYVLSEILKLMHPFMPFITEKIWQYLPARNSALIIADFPVASEKLNFGATASGFEAVIEAVRAVRARRSEMKVPPDRRPKMIIATDRTDVFTSLSGRIAKLAYAGEIEITSRGDTPDLSEYVSVDTSDAAIFIPMRELVDTEAERARISKEIEKARQQTEAAEAMLADTAFTSKAPERIIEAQREKLLKAKALLQNLEESIRRL